MTTAAAGIVNAIVMCCLTWSLKEMANFGQTLESMKVYFFIFSITVYRTSWPLAIDLRLKTIGIYVLVVLEAGNLRSRHRLGLRGHSSAHDRESAVKTMGVLFHQKFSSPWVYFLAILMFLYLQQPYSHQSNCGDPNGGCWRAPHPETAFSELTWCSSYWSYWLC